MTQEFHFIDTETYKKSFKKRFHKFLQDFVADVAHEIEGELPKDEYFKRQDVSTRIAMAVTVDALSDYVLPEIFGLCLAASKVDKDLVAEQMLNHSQSVHNRTILLLKEFHNDTQSKT